MKNIVTTLCLVLLTASITSAAPSTIQTSVTPPPVVITLDKNINVWLAQQVGVLSYTDTSTGWGAQVSSAQSPAQFRISATPTTSVFLTVPATIPLTRTGGTETATLTLTCRVGTSDAYPADKTQGAACGASATTSAAGWVYLELFPTALTLSVDVQGTYTGTATITVNY